jgi:SAM-dependent methyltransferase
LLRDPWKPHGLALLDYFHGDTEAQVIVHSENGEHIDFSVSIFFRKPPQFSTLEKTALDLCRGRVLDIGAGTGCHSLFLQDHGFSVCAIDILPEAVEIMTRRGVHHALCADIFSFHGGPFDTLLMMMNGVGVVANLSGLERFLRKSHKLLSREGQILLDSEEPGGVPGQKHAERRPNKYRGELRLQLEYNGEFGPPFESLYVDPDTLDHYASKTGWSCKVILQEDDGGYLAQLTPL